MICYNLYNYIFGVSIRIRTYFVIYAQIIIYIYIIQLSPDQITGHVKKTTTMYYTF